MNATASMDLPLDLPDAIAPEADPALRAVWQTIFAPTRPHMTFEQAMQDKYLRMGIQNAGLARQRRLRERGITPHKGDA
jgi:hypothetical protein